MKQGLNLIAIVRALVFLALNGRKLGVKESYQHKEEEDFERISFKLLGLRLKKQDLSSMVDVPIAKRKKKGAFCGLLGFWG